MMATFWGAAAVHLAIFDLDNTLLNGDSDYSWGQFLIRRGLVDPEVYRQANDAFYEDYKRGELDIQAYQRFVLASVAGKSPSDIQTLLEDFMREEVGPMRLGRADALLQSHRRQGHCLIIITATSEFITAPIARALNVPNLLATLPQMQNGRFTGEMTGTPCYQEGKIKRLNDWLAHQSAEIRAAARYFYSDSVNDIPLLDAVNYPVAVDPDPRLRQYAQDKKWPIISLRP